MLDDAGAYFFAKQALQRPSSSGNVLWEKMLAQFLELVENLVLERFIAVASP
jgi:hypothetical protein